MKTNKYNAMKKLLLILALLMPLVACKKEDNIEPHINKQETQTEIVNQNIYQLSLNVMPSAEFHKIRTLQLEYFNENGEYVAVNIQDLNSTQYVFNADTSQYIFLSANCGYFMYQNGQPHLFTDSDADWTLYLDNNILEIKPSSSFYNYVNL